MTTTLHRLPDREILMLTAQRSLPFLHDVSTQEVAGLPPGSGALAAFLSDKGRVRAVARVLAGDAKAILDAEGSPGLDRIVGKIAPLAGVEAELERWSGLRVAGDPAPLAALGLVPPSNAYDWAEIDGAVCVRGGWGDDGWDVLAPSPGSLLERLAAAGAARGDDAAVEEYRIAAGRPRFGADVTEDTLINETPLVRHAVSFAKGCYPGQESVARVHNLGQVNRMLRVLRLGAASAAAGDEVRSENETLGTVTSAAGRHAMAMIPAEVEPGVEVTVAGVPATVTDAGWI